MELRPYQKEAVAAVYDHLRRRDDHPCVVIPTAGGKTPVMATICRDAVRQWNGRVLILAHVKELLEQATEKLHAMAPDLWHRIWVYSAGLKCHDTEHPIIVAGIQSVFRRAAELDRFDLILIDEAHMLPPDGEGIDRTFLAEARAVNPNVRLVGLTATPYRMTTGMICGPENLLNHVCYEVGVRELIVQGFLCGLKTKAGRRKVDTSKLHIRGGEFIAGEVEALMDDDTLVRSACGEIVQHTQDRHSVLVFAAGVQHAMHVQRTLGEMGHECGFVCGDTLPFERADTLKRFKDSGLKYLVNVNVLTTGFDAGGELFDAWARRIPPDLLARLVVETTQRGVRHVFYRCEAPVCGNMKLAQRREGDKTVTLIETRGEGGLCLCVPTAGYEAIQGDLSTPPVLTEADRDALLAAAWELNEYLPPPVGETRPCGQRDAKESPVAASGDHNSDTGAFSADNSDNRQSRLHNSENGPTSASSVAHGAFPPENSHRPGDDFNDRGDVRDVLAQHGWSLAKPGENKYWRRPGKTSGWSASLKGRVFYVFSANAAPFEPSRAYSPFAVFALLNHCGDYETAARSLRMSGYGGDGPSDIRTGVDPSGILGQTGACGADDSRNAARPPDIPDPGPMPDQLLRMPGFVGEVMDYCLATAPYPNPVMAFAGALSLLAFLAGRKVRDPRDNRTNVYLLGLAHSSAGKDWPRKVNTRIVQEAPDGGGSSSEHRQSLFSVSACSVQPTTHEEMRS